MIAASAFGSNTGRFYRRLEEIKVNRDAYRQPSAGVNHRPRVVNAKLLEQLASDLRR